jgi:selenide,water dikinase
VYRLTPELAIAQTVDFLTPLVDDPYQFGQIAAANAISDIYAMGATPLLALNIVAFPTETLPMTVLGEILRGGADTAREADVRIIGGHSIDDREPKYGMAVTGLVHPDRILRNSTARPGDRLFLTKPLGMGIISTAIKRDLAGAALIARAVAVMTTLNKGAARAALDVGVDASTDVTGFGLLGHLREMTAGSGVGARIVCSRVPVLDGVSELARAGVVPGGTKRNLAYAEQFTSFGSGLDDTQRLIVADAQTSGGLLLAVPPQHAAALARALADHQVPAVAEIGEITDDPPGRIVVEG